jgi:uncharacterized protein
MLTGLAGLVMVAACGNDVPEPPPATKSPCQPIMLPLTGHVVDDADLLTAEAEQTLTAQLASLEDRTKHQMVVATVKTLQDLSVDRYTRCLGNHWGVGRKGIDDGVILLIAPNERRARIEVGDGLTRELTDAEASTILERDMIPSFRNGDFPAGIAAGAQRIMAEID